MVIEVQRLGDSIVMRAGRVCEERESKKETKLRHGGQQLLGARNARLRNPKKKQKLNTVPRPTVRVVHAGRLDTAVD